LEAKREAVARHMGLSESEAAFLAFEGTASNSTYNASDEMIRILFKTGEIRDISQVDDALIHQTLVSPVKKFYFCHTNGK
jgi:uncharacterized protein